MGWDLSGFLGIPVVEAARQCSTGIDQLDSETHGPDLSPPSGREGKIAETDLRWEEDSLFNTGWHFQGRVEVKATVSS